MPSKPDTDFSADLKEWFKNAGRIILHNWPMKLIALLSAIILWTMLITQDATLTREKTFTDVSVSITGTDALKRSGFIVVSGVSDLPTVNMRVNVPQLQYNDAAATTYNARIDLSRITQAGTQSVKISTTNSTTYGTVAEVTPDSVEVVVEEYIIRYRIPLRLVTTSQLPDGYYAGTATMDPNVVSIAGPRSLVEQVAWAEASFDLSTLPSYEGTVRTAVPFRLCAADGTEIDSSQIEVTSESVQVDSVIVEQTLYPTKVMNINATGLVTGTPADGYEITSVVISPDVITIAGKSDSLANIESLFPDTNIDVSGLTESSSTQIKLKKSTDIVYLSNDTINVAVEIAPIITEKTFSDLTISTWNVPAGMTARLSFSRANVIISGEKNWLSALKNSAVTLYCDLSGLEAGTYTLPIQCLVSGSDGKEYTCQFPKSTIEVTLSTK